MDKNCYIPWYHSQRSFLPRLDPCYDYPLCSKAWGKLDINKIRNAMCSHGSIGRRPRNLWLAIGSLYLHLAASKPVQVTDVAQKKVRNHCDIPHRLDVSLPGPELHCFLGIDSLSWSKHY